MRTKIINCLNGLWAALLIVFVFKGSESMQGVEQWQYTVGCSLFGVLAALPQFGFNWLQSGHTWANDKQEIIRALISGVVAAFVLSFVAVGRWMWIASILILLFNLALWKWGGKIFGK